MYKILLGGLVASLALPTSFSVAAQDDEAVMEEVIVSATRRDVAVMDIPQSIQAISADTLELPSFGNMSQVYNLVPGATVFSNKSPQEQGIQMRGSGVVQSNAADDTSPVGYYVDDIPYVDISTPVPPPIGTFDLERVEIIRGPQGTSYGQDSSGGSVILRTAPVDLENFGYKVRGGITNVGSVDDNGKQVGGVINIPVIEDVFGIRASLLSETDPGFGQVAGRADIKNPLESSRDSIRIKAFAKVSDTLSLEATHSEWNTEYNVLPGTQIADSRNGRMVLTDLSTPMLLELFPDGRLKNDFEISWTTFKAVLALDFADITYSAGRVDTPKKETNSEFEFDVGLGPMFSAVVFNQPAESTTQELRIVSSDPGKLRWLGGLFLMDAESDSAGWTQTPDFFISEQRSDPIEAEAWAIYAEVEYDLNDQWGVQAGLRYHDEERAYTNIYALGFAGEPTFGPFSMPSPTTVESREFDNVSYRLGLTWEPNESTLLYLTQSSANRAPIVLGQPDRIALETAGVSAPGNADASELVNTEIGVKWTGLEGRLQVEAVYAHGDWKDVPIWAQLNIVPQPISVAIGGTDAVVETWEVAASLQITDNLNATYSGAYTSTEVQGVPDGALVTGFPGAVRDGGDLFNYSPTTHNLGLSWEQDVGNYAMFASVNYVYRERVDGINVFDFAASEYVPAEASYENASINIGARQGAWTGTLSFNNVTDHDGRYLPSSQGVVGGVYGLIQAPRSVSFQLTYDAL